jgi:hypothetical protein
MGSPHEFDFWLGRWRVRWGNGGHGSNVIERDYGGKVIVERFDGNPGTPLRGTSMSVFDESRGLWQQTWADDAGHYFAFEGAFADGEMTLFCDRHNGPNQDLRYRMRFFGRAHVGVGVLARRRQDVG